MWGMEDDDTKLAQLFGLPESSKLAARKAWNGVQAPAVLMHAARCRPPKSALCSWRRSTVPWTRPTGARVLAALHATCMPSTQSQLLLCSHGGMTTLPGLALLKAILSGQ